MRALLRAILGLSFASGFVLAVPAQANELRYNVSGTACLIQGPGAEVRSSSSGLLANWAFCPIPTGPSLVSLAALNGPWLTDVNVSVEVHDENTWISAEAVAHDWNSSDFCTYDQIGALYQPGFNVISLNFAGRNACAVDPFWGANVTIVGSHPVTIKAVHVYGP